MVLTTQPTADVTIALSSSNTTEGHGGAGEPDLHDRELERGADGDGDRRQRRLDDGDIVVHDRDGGGDEHRPELRRRSTPSDVAVTNTDNDSAGITVTPTTGLTTTEAGGTATFTVVLTYAADGGRDDRR